MSSGDRGEDPVKFAPAEALRIMRLQPVLLRLRRPYTVNQRFDIPYLAGYSRDGYEIFIDRDLGVWEYDGKAVTSRIFLAIHERTEKALMDCVRAGEREVIVALRFRGDQRNPVDLYYHTHGVATAVEEHAVSEAHGATGLASYNAFMKTQVKDAEDERIRRVPRNLDMTPYQGSDKMDERLRRKMQEAMR